MSLIFFGGIMTKTTLPKIALLLTMLVMPLIGQAQVQRLQLQVNSVSEGRHVIGIKQLINQQYPRLALAQFDLVQVAVQAKSAAGQGQMQLNIGQDSTVRQTVPGIPRDFNNNMPGTFTVLQFQAPINANHRGAWQLEMQGRINVNRMIVTVQSRRTTPPPRQLQEHELGQFRFNKFIETQEIVRVNKASVKEIVFEAKRNMVEVIEVRALLQNGDELFLDGLTGFYRENGKKVQRFSNVNGERIRSLVIRGVSPNPFNSRGEIKVNISSFD
jgi:hypothetical protein